MLSRLAEQARDLRFDAPVVMHLLGARARTPAAELAVLRAEATRICGAPAELDALRDSYLEILDVYHEVEWRSPFQRTEGTRLTDQIAAEPW